MNSSWFRESLGKILVAIGYFEQKSAKFGLFILKIDNAENVIRLNAHWDCGLVSKILKKLFMILDQINSTLNYSLFEVDKAE